MTASSPKPHPHAVLDDNGKWELPCAACVYGPGANCPKGSDFTALCSGFSPSNVGPELEGIPDCGKTMCHAPACNDCFPKDDPKRQVSLPEDVETRREMPMFDGFIAYFPNAMAEVARLSWKATQQHHPEEGMHWDRTKSLDHLNKIGRHMVDAGKFDNYGERHSTMLAWRAMANLQEELERDLKLPPSPASRNRPDNF